MARTGRQMLIVGHSHVGAIRAAAQIRREADSARPRARTINVLDPRFGGEFDPDPSERRFSKGLRHEIARQVALHDPIVASALSGNFHTLICLVRSDEPFDFILSGEPSPKLDAQATIVSEDSMRARLTDLMRNDLDRLTMLREEVGTFWHIESPPPVAARSFIERRIEPYFRAMPELERNGISPGGVRYRTWRLACRILAEHIRAIGCSYLPSPRTIFDPAGFLSREFANDSTHGNAAYGEEILRALEQATAREEASVGDRIRAFFRRNATVG